MLYQCLQSWGTHLNEKRPCFRQYNDLHSFFILHCEKCIRTFYIPFKIFIFNFRNIIVSLLQEPQTELFSEIFNSVYGPHDLSSQVRKVHMGSLFTPLVCVCNPYSSTHGTPPPPSHSLLYLTFTSPASPALERLWHLHTALSSVFCKLSWVFFKQYCTGDTDAPQASSVRMHSSRFSQRVSLEIVFNTKTQLFWVEMAR